MTSDPAEPSCSSAWLKPAFSIALLATAGLTGDALRRLTAPWSEGAQEIALVPLVRIVLMVFKRSLIRVAGQGISNQLGRFALFASVVVISCWAKCWAHRRFGTTFVCLVRREPMRGYGGGISLGLSRTWHRASGRRRGCSTRLERSAPPSPTSGPTSNGSKAADTMIALGVPSPLGEAEAQVAHWIRQRDAARERFHALGYRARFRT